MTIYQQRKCISFISHAIIINPKLHFQRLSHCFLWLLRKTLVELKLRQFLHYTIIQSVHIETIYHQLQRKCISFISHAVIINPNLHSQRLLSQRFRLLFSPFISSRPAPSGTQHPVGQAAVSPESPAAWPGHLYWPQSCSHRPGYHECPHQLGPNPGAWL